MSELFVEAGAFGRELAAWLVRMNLSTALLLAVVLGADVLLARRVSAAWRIALYALIPLRLLLPADWVSPLAIPVSPEAVVGPVWSVAFDAAPAQVRAGASATVPAGGSAAGSAWMLAPGAYLVVGGVLLARWLLAVRSLRRRVEAGTVRVSTREGVRVIEHENLGPMVIGALRPAVVLPAGLDAAISPRRVEWVLRHELTHIRRADPLLSWSLRLACAALWPIVPLWIGAARVRSLIEQACDEATVRGEDRSAYGEALLTVAQRLDGVRSVPALAFGVGVRSRIAALARSRRWPGAAQACAIGAAALLVAACAGERSAKQDRGSSIPEAQTEVTQAESGPVYQLDMRVLAGLPADERASFLGNACFAPLSASELERFVERAEKDPSTATMTAPRILVREDQWASIRVGEDDALGNLASGIEIMVKATGGAEGTWLDARIIEAASSPSATSELTTKVLVARGKSGAVLFPGARRDQQRVLLVTPSQPKPQASDAADFPQIMTMMNVMSTRGYTSFDSEPLLAAGGARGRRLLVTKGADGALIIGADDPASRERVKSAWAVIASDSDVLGMMDAMRAHAGGSVTAAPVLLTRPDQSGTVKMEERDKAHQAAGREMTMTARPEGEGIAFNFSGRGAASVRAESIVVGAGESLLIFVTTDAGAYEIYAVRPHIVADPNGLPHQTSTSLESTPK